MSAGRWIGFALAGALLLGGTARAALERAPYRADPFADRVDALVREGAERPERALTALRALESANARPTDRRRLLLAIGSVEARRGDAARAGAVADQLLALAADDPGDRALAASNLVRALVAEDAGQLDVAAALAQAALPAFQAGCPGAPAAATERRVCDYRPAWRALRLLAQRAGNQGLSVTATARAQSALVLAEWAGDARRSAVNLSALAIHAAERGEHALAQQLVGQAERLAAQGGDAADRALVVNTEARLAVRRGDRQGALRLYDEARGLAALADAPHLQAMLLNNISDAYARARRPADALRAVDRALAILPPHGDVGLRRVLINNAGIAKIGLGRLAEGKRDLARLLALWEQGGATGMQVSTLLEFGQALAAAGDARGALELYHRERALSAALMQANRSAALKELQTRFDADARRRDIELLSRDNALKTEALANRDLLQRIGWLLAAVMGLAVVLVTILYRRVRETHRRLEASRVQLQAQSERDPLTNLANRRHFQSVMTTLSSRAGFEGALLLVDIDHFKHVNDVHGHAAGDQVLVEVARRLNEAVRDEDMVVRWGGEEFLVLAPRASDSQAEQIALRVLRVLGDTPIALGGGAGPQLVQVTASIGYGRFPLPPHGASVPWEQAVNLADMALYTAKNQGRNRAVGIVGTSAATAEALRDVEADFDRAWHEGRVTLRQTPGSPAAPQVRAA
jgi:diguanylate cyclase (GGDEF)-like protein